MTDRGMSDRDFESEHPIVTANREAKAVRLANAVLVLHSALSKNGLVPESPADYCREWPQPVWDAVGRAIGEVSPPNTSIPLAIGFLEERLEEAS